MCNAKDKEVGQSVLSAEQEQPVVQVDDQHSVVESHVGQTVVSGLQPVVESQDESESQGLAVSEESVPLIELDLSAKETTQVSLSSVKSSCSVCKPSLQSFIVKHKWLDPLPDKHISSLISGIQAMSWQERLSWKEVLPPIVCQ